MKQNNCNEELQSRCGFFKKATKSVLPIVSAVMFIAAVIMVGTPTVAKAKAASALGCTAACACTTCTETCAKDSACTETCAKECSGCKNSCATTCQDGSIDNK